MKCCSVYRQYNMQLWAEIWTVIVTIDIAMKCCSVHRQYNMQLWAAVLTVIVTIYIAMKCCSVYRQYNMQLWAAVLTVIVTIYIAMKSAHNFCLLTAQIGGYRLFNVNVIGKEWDIIVMLTCALNSSNNSQCRVLVDARH